MNLSIKIGNLVADPETKYFDNDKSVTEFRIAVSRTYKDRDGNRKADFFRCKAFGKKGEFVQQYATKGDKICVQGSDETREWEGSDGVKKSIQEIIVSEVELLGGRKDA